ncbi:MAG: hypothetical protein ABW194_08320, partial [Novosphingobium sp.]
MTGRALVAGVAAAARARRRASHVSIQLPNSASSRRKAGRAIPSGWRWRSNAPRRRSPAPILCNDAETGSARGGRGPGNLSLAASAMPVNARRPGAVSLAGQPAVPEGGQSPTRLVLTSIAMLALPIG